MDKKITTDTIIDYLKEQIENKIPLSPNTWLDAAEKLNVLREEEDDQLIDLMQKVAIIKSDMILEGKSVAQAEAVVQSTKLYVEMQKQKARCARITEFIRIEKIRARLKDEEYRQSGM